MSDEGFRHGFSFTRREGLTHDSKQREPAELCSTSDTPRARSTDIPQLANATVDGKERRILKGERQFPRSGAVRGIQAASPEHALEDLL
jgi:hypothetical protein